MNNDCECNSCLESELTDTGLLNLLVAQRTALVAKLIEGEPVDRQIEYLSRRIDRVCADTTTRDFVTA